MARVRIGQCELGGGVPKIAVIVDGSVSVDTVTAYADQGASLLEIRADLFPGDFSRVTAYVTDLRSRSALPLIGTIRETSDNRKNRLDLFRELIPLVDSIDIEVDAAIGPEVVGLCRDKVVIVSEHDFEKTPDSEGLVAIAESARRLGADIVKVAVMAQTPGDVTRLLRFCEESPLPVVGIAMGRQGMISRLVAPLFGSLFSYAFAGDQEIAPGQMSLGELARAVERFYPQG